MKVEIMLEDDVRCRETSDGICVTVPFYLTADIIRQTFVPDAEHEIEDVLPNGKDGRKVNWKISGDEWDVLVKKDLAPTYFGKFICDLRDVKALDFVDSYGNVKNYLIGKIHPISSEEGVPVGPTSELEIIKYT